MEKVIELDGRKFKIRGLRRKEVKALRAEGLDLTGLTGTNGDQAMDRVFEMVGLEEQPGFDEIYHASAIEAFREIMDLTYLVGDRAKN